MNGFNNQPDLFSGGLLQIIAVSELNWYLREVIDANPVLQDIWVRGEISNLSMPSSGHLYFTLKDDRGQLRCVSFKGQGVKQMWQNPANGQAVIVHGRVSVYETQGQLQLYVDVVQPEGTGILHLKFADLRSKLEAEGLFEPSRKRAEPKFPRKIGVVTSPTGAAIRDIISVLGRRYPVGELVLAGAVVQGSESAESICDSLRILNERDDIDVIILARGGGSIEDLWSFNEEKVARAIYASRIPIISGVGHETDTTIADLVADVRAATPTAAAEIAAPDVVSFRQKTETIQSQMLAVILKMLSDRRFQLTRARRNLTRLSPSGKLKANRDRLKENSRRLDASVSLLLSLGRERVRANSLRLEALSPLAVLDRGYSICWNESDGKIVRNVSQVNPNDPLAIQVSDGKFRAVAK